MIANFRHRGRAGFALLLAAILTTACSVNDREHKPFQPQGQARVLETPLPGRNYTSLYPAIPAVDPVLQQQKKRAIMQMIRGRSATDAHAILTDRGYRCYETRCSYGRIRQHEHDDHRVYITENTVIEIRAARALAEDDVTVAFAVLTFRQPD